MCNIITLIALWLQFIIFTLLSCILQLFKHVIVHFSCVLNYFFLAWRLTLIKFSRAISHANGWNYPFWGPSLSVPSRLWFLAVVISGNAVTRSAMLYRIILSFVSFLKFWFSDTWNILWGYLNIIINVNSMSLGKIIEWHMPRYSVIHCVPCAVWLQLAYDLL